MTRLIESEKTLPNTVGIINKLVTVFAPAEAGFRLRQSADPQLLLLHPRQICNGSCARTPNFAALRWAKRAAARNLNPAP